MAKQKVETAPVVDNDSVESLPTSLTPEQFKQFEDDENYKYVLDILKMTMELGIYRYAVRTGDEMLVVVEGELRTPILEVLKDHTYFKEMRTVPQKITLAFGYTPTPDDE